jgi:hypothetical protein
MNNLDENPNREINIGDENQNERRFKQCETVHYVIEFNEHCTYCTYLD